MKPNATTLTTALALALSMTATVGYSKDVERVAAGCPPGLAKKNPPCVPPGQAKKYIDKSDYRRYRVGDRIDNDYFWIDSPGRYGLNRDGYYLRSGEYVYRVDRQTREVLNLIGAVIDVLN